MKKKQIRVIAEIAILVGVAFVLDFLAGLFSPFKQGGSISIAMLPIFIIAFRHGWKDGVFAGLIFGTLQVILLGSEIFAWIYEPNIYKIIAVIFLDYIFAFSFLGLAGIFKDPLKKPKSFTLGIALGSFLRYICHGISGVVIWGNFAADWGIDNVWFYSFIFYNLPYMAASFGLCLIIGLALYNRKVWSFGLNIIN